jgi:disulfide bond formation protein DsbB
VDVSAVARLCALLALVAGAGALLVGLAARARSGPLARLRHDVGPVALPLAALVAATATAGSLYFSEVANFTPCPLCWYQRCAMYPLALILTVAAVRRDVAVRRYAIPLALLGAAVSIYHVQLERFPDQASLCTLDGPSCSAPPVEQFGFVTLAVMALCGFAAIVALLAAAQPTTPSASASAQAAPFPARRRARTEELVP